jgi:thiol-disulfide isomerase/thioredoxin
VSVDTDKPTQHATQQAAQHATAKRDRQKARRAARLEVRAAAERRQRTRSRALAVAGAVLLVAVLAGLAVVVVRGNDVTLGVAAATVETGSTPLVPATGGGVEDPAVGATVPVAEGRTFAGEPVSIGVPGQAQAVVFMAHWCSFCQEEMPQIAGWVDDGLLPADVELVGVSTRHDPARPNWPPDEWFVREAFPGTPIVDSTDAVAEAWGLAGTPMWVFTDADGTVVARYSGVLTSEQFAEGAGLASAG